MSFLKAYSSFRAMQDDLLHGTISCSQVVESFLANIEANRHLNAFLTVFDNEARQWAEVVDRKISEGTAGRLAGLVVGIKDVLAYKDHPLQAASRMLDGFVSQYTATAVQRLLDEDAIIIGRQNCDEFGMGSSSENSAFGPVLHNVDTTRVPGGSSGGSAVAVSAGMCHVSLGSDTGGSVRQPAAFCGVIGLKPTYSRVSRYGLVAYASSFDCVGIFANAVEDVALVLQTISGADDMDSTVSKHPVPDYEATLRMDSSKKKIAYVRSTIDNDGLQPEIREAFSQTIQTFVADGNVVEAIDLDLLEYCLPAYYILATAEASANLSRYDGVRYGHRSTAAHDLMSTYKASRSEGFGAEVKRRIMLGTFVLSADYHDAYYAKAQRVRRILRDQTRAIFEHYDFILMPAAPSTAFRLGEHTNNPLAMYLADVYSVYANVAGIPGISVPCGADRHGLPIGLQLLADDFEEAKLLAFANRLMNLK